MSGSDYILLLLHNNLEIFPFLVLQERDRRETEQWIEDVKQMRAARNTQLPSTPQTSTEESASGVPPKKNLNFRKSQPER